jgi:glucokinase
LTPVETIGVDLGGTKMAVGVVDEGRRILYETTGPSTNLTEDELVDELEREIEAARAACPEVAAVGMGLPCTIDRERGVAITAVNLPITDVPIRDLMTERLDGLPVFIDNDANVAALAEHRFGVAKGARNVVMLTIGTGIGGGVILEGRPYRGTIGAGAELGHVVVDLDGPPCQGNCPNRGCIETFASGTALARDGRAAAERAPDSALGRALASGEAFTGRTVTEAALAGDEAALDVVREAGRHLGAAFSSYANIFDPDMIICGGGVMALGDLLLEPARAELERRALPPMNKTAVKAAKLGPKAGMVGAAAMAMQELEDVG